MTAAPHLTGPERVTSPAPVHFRPQPAGLSGPPRPGAAERAERPLAVKLLRVFVLLLFIIPSNTTLAPVGAAGFPAGLLGVAALGLYATWTLLGTHDPLAHRYPTRWAFTSLWLISFASYIACQFTDRTPIESNGADRWLLYLAGMTGVALLAAEGLRTMAHILDVLRALVWGGAFCGFVAALQFWLGFDLSSLIGSAIPGFTYNADLGGIQGRGALNRVPGTTLHPIELGAVTAILLPIAITLAITDRDRSRWQRFTPLLLIGLCVPVSVSRTAILAAAVAFIVFVCQVGARRRAAAILALPFVLAGVFLTIPGLLLTLSGFFLNAGTDTSVSTRTDDYPLVESLVRLHPWFGKGGGTYLPDDLLTILDNTYLKWVIEFGIVGLVVMIFMYIGLPVMTAIVIRKRARTPETALLAVALSAGLASSALAAATFDALTFPTLTYTQAFAIGIVGALWQVVARQNRAAGKESGWTR